MPSRKRAKGKARKSKAADRHWKEVEQYHWKGWVLWEDRDENKAIQCNHGHRTIFPSADHPVYSFVDGLFLVADTHLSVSKDFERAGEGLWSLLEYVKKSFNDHSSVWMNEDNRKMAIDILLGIGTNAILYGGGGARALAIAALLLEHAAEKDTPSIRACQGTDDETIINLTVCAAAPMIRDLRGGKARDVIKFLRKRNTCDCLKAKYTLSKRRSKRLGVCNSCQKTFDKRLLKLCGHCKIGQYCSIDCQSHAWPGHKSECKFLRLGQDAWKIACLTTED